MENTNKPLIGISIGDINGIGPEVILKALKDKKYAKYCDFIIYGSTKVLSYYKKVLDIEHFDYTNITAFEQSEGKHISVVNFSNEEVTIEPGNATLIAGEIALQCIDISLGDLKDGRIDALVTGPINKSTIKVPTKDFRGHTDYIRQYFGMNDSLMLMVEDNFKVALATGHVPIRDLHKFIDTKSIVSKLEILNKTLKEDFLINRPKIAVLGLNPHAGDNNLIGKEESEIINPAISIAKDKGILAFGSYPADGFFGAGQFQKFDAVLAMYHDQGLIPFKSFAFSNGVNYTAGMPIVRTSPDHGTAFDIAGKNLANPGSMEAAIFTAIDVVRNRNSYKTMTSNPLPKSSVGYEQNG